MQQPPVLLLGHHTAAGGHHQGVALADGAEHLAFGTEARFAIALKDLRDAAAGGLLDHGIGIDKAVAKLFRQRPPVLVLPLPIIPTR